ncbi:MAG: DUF6090 family protein [Flavobacteriaceae bacterium]|nr:DUF6090 family protein [Flavobacteriaceae bacterium]
MINFFRKKRKKLADDNKTLKYARYAIGEIVLVVIGILIALSINNANENRKARIQEITILKNIQEDISLDTLDFNYNIKFHRNFINAEKRLLQFLQSNLQEPRDSINYSDALSVPLLVALHKSTFTNLQNNQIGILTNNLLKKNISRLYDFFFEAILMVENEKSVYETYSSKKVFFQKYFKLTETFYMYKDQQTINEDYFNPNFIKVDMEFKDIKGAKNDEAFKIELNESIFFRQVKIDLYNDMLKRVKELNQEINKELEVLSN